MSKELKSINLVLENCEEFVIDRKHIGNFYVGGIERIIQRSACNSISEDYYIKTFHIRIHKDANIKTGYNEVTVFERIKSNNDITQLLITYDNDTCDHFFVHWAGDMEYSNGYQKSKVSEINSDLFIVVDETNSIECIFEYELTEDDNFSWEMYAE